MLMNPAWSEWSALWQTQATVEGKLKWKKLPTEDSIYEKIILRIWNLYIFLGMNQCVITK